MKNLGKWAEANMDRAEIEFWAANADPGMEFGGLRQREAVLFRNLAFANGCGAVITPENAETRTYKATIVERSF